MSLPIQFFVYISVCSLLPISLGHFANDSTKGHGRDERFLSLFKIVRIPHTICTPNNDAYVGVGQMTGSCYSAKECTRVGGENAGSCAQGYGVCCLVVETCTSGEPVTVTVNGTHLVNPSNIKNSTICQYRFPRPKNVCQVRLDFNKFESNQAGPFNDAPNGDCNADTLTFTGASNTKNLGPLCGNLTGQQIYLDYGMSNELDMYIFTAYAQSQNWDIQVTYIKCDSPERAPPGCLQYFTEQSGTVQSFNWNGQQQLNNEDYSICVKTIPGMNQITWKTCGGFYDFFISGLAPIEPPPGSDFPPLTNPLSGNDCMLDWVMFFGDNKYCGNALAGPITTTTQPFVVQVHFQEYELGPPGDPNGVDDRNTGFCLMYQQSP